MMHHLKAKACFSLPLRGFVMFQKGRQPVLHNGVVFQKGPWPVLHNGVGFRRGYGLSYTTALCFRRGYGLSYITTLCSEGATACLAQRDAKVSSGTGCIEG